MGGGDDKAKKAELNPRTEHYEWGGPIGAAFMVLTIPLTVLILNALCDTTSCTLTLDTLPQIYPRTMGAIENALPQLWPATQIYGLWCVFHAIFYLLPIGERKKGQTLRDGNVLTYNINAFQSMIVSYALVFGGHWYGCINVATLADMFLPLALASIVISGGMAILLYLASFRSSKVMLALGGNTGNPIFDFWVGRELNPRIGSLDLKFMFELRPGLIGWTLLCWAYVIKAYQEAEATGVAMSNGIVLVAIFQTWYVIDGLYLEAGNCTMMDIVYDGFGFMLAAGDLAWVPFLYTLQCRYLQIVPTTLPTWLVALCVAMHLVGYGLFRAANSTKDIFRRDPKHPFVRNLKVMKTSAGKSLIISGVWGVCRHPNYVGDWFMTLSWSMLCGFGSLLPYFQPVYFALLLIHRQLRDEEQMQIKYGDKDWKAFCKHVPYRLIPYIY